MTLLEALAKFVIRHGKHEEWCNVVTQSSPCSCGYGEIFDAARNYLKNPVDEDFLRLARSVETIQNQLGRVLDMVSKLVEEQS